MSLYDPFSQVSLIILQIWFPFSVKMMKIAVATLAFSGAYFMEGCKSTVDKVRTFQFRSSHKRKNIHFLKNSKIKISPHKNIKCAKIGHRSCGQVRQEIQGSHSGTWPGDRRQEVHRRRY